MKQNFKKRSFSRFLLILYEIHKEFLFLLMFHSLIVFNYFLGILFKNISIMLRNHT
ncbi:hypothetical protein N201_03030 [Helicobacter pylori UM066]|nr:hypothetical protein N201_03030 [Helicobacter pylori UM066]